MEKLVSFHVMEIFLYGQISNTTTERLDSPSLPQTLPLSLPVYLLLRSILGTALILSRLSAATEHFQADNKR
jgi:hypothetical protein